MYKPFPEIPKKKKKKKIKKSQEHNNPSTMKHIRIYSTMKQFFWVSLFWLKTELENQIRLERERIRGDPN